MSLGLLRAGRDPRYVVRGGEFHRSRGRRRRCDEKSGGDRSGTDQVARSAVHIAAGQGCRALLSSTCGMFVFVMSEVLRRALRLVAAVGRDHRPDCLERHDEQQDNQQPTAHRTHSRSGRVEPLNHSGEFGGGHYRAVILAASARCQDNERPAQLRSRAHACDEFIVTHGVALLQERS